MISKNEILARPSALLSILILTISIAGIIYLHISLLLKGLSLDESVTVSVLEKDSILLSIQNTILNIHSGWLYPFFLTKLYEGHIAESNEYILRIPSLLFTILFIYRASVFASEFGFSKSERYFFALISITMPSVLNSATMIRPYGIASLLSIVFIEIIWQVSKTTPFKIIPIVFLGIGIISLFHPVYALSFALCCATIIPYMMKSKFKELFSNKLNNYFLILIIAVTTFPIGYLIHTRQYIVNNTTIITDSFPDIFIFWYGGCLALLAMALYKLCQLFISLLQQENLTSKPNYLFGFNRHLKVLIATWATVPIIFWLIHSQLGYPINFFRYMTLPSIFMVLCCMDIIKSVVPKESLFISFSIFIFCSSFGSFTYLAYSNLDDLRHVKYYFDSINDSNTPVLISTGQVETASEAYLLDKAHECINIAPLKAYGIKNPVMSLPAVSENLVNMPRYSKALLEFINSSGSHNFIVIANDTIKWSSPLRKLLGIQCIPSNMHHRYSGMKCQLEVPYLVTSAKMS